MFSLELFERVEGILITFGIYLMFAMYWMGWFMAIKLCLLLWTRLLLNHTLLSWIWLKVSFTGLLLVIVFYCEHDWRFEIWVQSFLSSFLLRAWMKSGDLKVYIYRILHSKWRKCVFTLFHVWTPFLFFSFSFFKV